MKFSAQEEYGLRCLLQIARRGAGSSATIPELSRAEGLSQAHVAKILAQLKKDGFLKSTRGQAGGYALARSAEQIFVVDVLTCLGGKLYDDGYCERHAGHLAECAHIQRCGLRSLWGRIQSAVDEALRGLSLHDLMLSEPPIQGFVSRATVGLAVPKERS
jgi:Rrf2 family protein